jgi:hypothetical protein
MPIWITTAGWFGSILAILALVIALLKQVIGFIGFLTLIIKIGLFLLFAAVFLGVGILVFKAWQSSKTSND